MRKLGWTPSRKACRKRSKSTKHPQDDIKATKLNQLKTSYVLPDLILYRLSATLGVHRLHSVLNKPIKY